MEITKERVTLGHLTYDVQGKIVAERMGNLFVLQLPFVLTGTKWGNRKATVDHIRGFVRYPRGLIGRIDTHLYRDPMREWPDREIQLQVFAPITAVQEYEQYRAGTEPKFSLSLDMSLILMDEADAQISQAEALATCDASCEIKPARDRWLDAISNMELKQIFVAEVAIDESIGNDKLGAHIEQAVVSYYEGGIIGWENCVIHVRKGLERLAKLHALAKPKYDEGSPLFSKDEPHADRINLLFWALKHFSNPAAHENEAYSQAEAQMALAMLLNLAQLLGRKADAPSG